MNRQNSFAKSSKASPAPSRRSRSLIRSNSNLYRQSTRSISQTPSNNKYLQTPTNKVRNPRESERKSVKKTDTRPVQNKQWQANEAAKIEEFLRDIGEQQCLNNGQKLRPLTLSNFVQILNILLEPIVDVVCLNTANYVEKLPTILNVLGYPGTISASNLKTAYTLHSWPSIVAVLSFLLEIHSAVISKESTDAYYDLNSGKFDKLVLNQKLKNFHTQLAFKQYCRGVMGEEVTATMQEAYAKDLGLLLEFKETPAEITRKLEIRKEECKKKQFHLLQDKKKIDSLVQAEVKKNLTAKAKLHEKLENLAKKQEATKVKEEEIKNRKQQIQNLKGELEIVKQKLDNLTKKLPATSNLDVGKIKKIITDLQNKIEEMKADKESLEDRKKYLDALSDNTDLSITKCKSKVRQCVKENNSKMYVYTLRYPELEQCLLSENSDMNALTLETLQQVLEKKKELQKNCLERKAEKKEEKKRLQHEIQQARETQIKLEQDYLDLEKVSQKKKMQVQELKIQNKKKEDALIQEINNLEHLYKDEEKKLSAKEQLVATIEKKISEGCPILANRQQENERFVQKHASVMQTLQKMSYKLQADQNDILQGYIDWEEKELDVINQYAAATKGKEKEKAEKRKEKKKNKGKDGKTKGG